MVTRHNVKLNVVSMLQKLGVSYEEISPLSKGSNPDHHLQVPNAILNWKRNVGHINLLQDIGSSSHHLKKCNNSH